MILISLLLAATPAPAARPEDVRRREAARPEPARLAARSKRMIELEAVVRALASSGDRPEMGQGPDGL